MQKTGFGKVGSYSTMYSTDSSRKDPGEWDYIAYPAPGLFPVNFFDKGYAWSISINGQKYKIPDPSEVKPTITPVKIDFKQGKIVPVNQPLTLDTVYVNQQGFGRGECVIFRPRDFKLAVGGIYQVQISGLTRDDKECVIRYIVEFYEPGKSK
jgi:hypothetical protein